MTERNPHRHITPLHRTEHIPQPMGIKESDFQATPLTGVSKDGSTGLGPCLHSLDKQASHHARTNFRASSKENVAIGTQPYRSCQVNHLYSSKDTHHSHRNARVPIPPSTLTARVADQSRGSTLMTRVVDQPRGCVFPARIKQIILKGRLIALWRTLTGWLHR